MICAGIDSGSRALKLVLLDEDQHLKGRICHPQSMFDADYPRQVLDELLGQIGVSPAEVASVVATGYGRHRVAFADDAITEITCHARGVHKLLPRAKSIIEIGGQDSKVIKLDGNGRVRDFMMNDRCAAGTGRFLEMTADLLRLGLEEMGRMALGSVQVARISSTCAVFAESEILGLMTSGQSRQEIAAGVTDAVAARVCAMTGASLEEPVAFTGGVAMIPGMREAISRHLGCDAVLVEAPQFSGALGAALFAAEIAGIPAKSALRAQRF